MEGSITVNGVNVLEEPRLAHREMGFLADFFGLYDKLTVEQALTYFAKAHDVSGSEVEQCVSTIISQLHLTDKTHSEIGQLSRGMIQKLVMIWPTYIFLWVNYTMKARRADTLAITYLVILYILIPTLAAKMTDPSILNLFIAVPGNGAMLTIIPPAIQAALMVYILRYRFKDSGLYN